MSRLLCLAGLVLAATPILSQTPSSEVKPAPTLGLVKRTNDQSLEILRTKTEMHPVRYTVQVPVTVTAEVDGKSVVKTEYRTEERTRMNTVQVYVAEAVALDAIEVRTLGGAKVAPSEAAALFDGELRPVLLVARQQEIVDGKSVTKAVRFDASYLSLFKPETLVLLLPPQVTAAPALPIPPPPVATPPAK